MPSRGGVSLVHLEEDVAVHVSNVDPIPVTVTGSGGGPQPVIDANQSGVWGYAAGVTGSTTIPAGGKVLQITASSLFGGTVQINTGPSVTIPARGSLCIEPKGNLVAPTIVFSNTTAFFVEYVNS